MNKEAPAIELYKTLFRTASDTFLNSPWMWGVLALLAVIVILAIIKRLIPKRRARYRAQGYLFTKTEWHFAQTLQVAIRQDWLMMGKVRIADLLAVVRDPKLDRGEWLRAFSRISQKHIDYVLVDPESGHVACCIELDDPSHERQDRIQRDIFVNAAFAQAGLPLLRIPTAKHYDPQALRQHIHTAIQRRPQKGNKASKTRRQRQSA